MKLNTEQSGRATKLDEYFSVEAPCGDDVAVTLYNISLMLSVGPASSSICFICLQHEMLLLLSSRSKRKKKKKGHTESISTGFLFSPCGYYYCIDYNSGVATVRFTRARRYRETIVARYRYMCSVYSVLYTGNITR